MITEKELNTILGLFVDELHNIKLDNGFHYRIEKIPGYEHIKQKLKEKGILELNAKEKLEECYNNIYRRDIIVEDFVRDLYTLALKAIEEAKKSNE